MGEIGAHLLLGCQRTGCDAEEIIDLGSGFGPRDTCGEDFWPEGWGWDVNGNNLVLHCPEHRDAAPVTTGPEGGQEDER